MPDVARKIINANSVYNGGMVRNTTPTGKSVIDHSGQYVEVNKLPASGVGTQTSTIWDDRFDDRAYYV